MIYASRDGLLGFFGGISRLVTLCSILIGTMKTS
jgi:hypothetical protein